MQKLESASKLNQNSGVVNNFSFADNLEKIISILSNRSQDIVKRRFGIDSAETQTLESIGKKYKITRERVRQILEEELKKIRAQKDHPVFVDVRNKIKLAIESKDGIIKEEDIVSYFSSQEDMREERAIRFFLECLNKIDLRKGGVETDKAVALLDFDFKTWKNIESRVIEFLDTKKDIFSGDKLLKSFEKKYGEDIDPKRFINYITVSRRVKSNVFGKWGLSHWIEISPKIIWQKVYIILKEWEEPLHFQEIARLIDESNLGSRAKTHPQTVHNELIKNEHFVLVGRGLYALKEWGYKEGTVRDVLEKVIEESKKPLDREEIVDKVLEMRQVKKSTVMINLNKYFKKIEGDRYVLKK